MESLLALGDLEDGVQNDVVVVAHCVEVALLHKPI